MRFTQTRDAFYIITLYAPNDTLVLNSPVPYVEGLDQVVTVGGILSGSVVPSELLANGSLRLNVSQEFISSDEYAWVFKIPYDSNSTSGSGPSSGSGPGTTSGGVGSRPGETTTCSVAVAVGVGTFLISTSWTL